MINDMLCVLFLFLYLLLFAQEASTTEVLIKRSILFVCLFLLLPKTSDTYIAPFYTLNIHSHTLLITPLSHPLSKYNSITPTHTPCRVFSFGFLPFFSPLLLTSPCSPDSPWPSPLRTQSLCGQAQTRLGEFLSCIRTRTISPLHCSDYSTFTDSVSLLSSNNLYAPPHFLVRF